MPNNPSDIIKLFSIEPGTTIHSIYPTQNGYRIIASIRGVYGIYKPNVDMKCILEKELKEYGKTK